MSTASIARVMRRLRLVVAAAAALALAFFLAVGISPAAHASADPGLLGITVSDKTGAPLGGLQIAALSAADWNAHIYQDVVSAVPGNARGEYDLLLTANTDYILAIANPTSGSDGYFEASDVMTTGTTVRVAPDQLTELDFSLDDESTISGKATNSAKKSLSGIQVGAYEFDGTNWNLVRTDTTGLLGTYSFSGLPAGSFKIAFTDPSQRYLTQYSGVSPSLDSASSIFLGQDSSATVNAQLALGGSISGAVSSSAGGALSGVVPVAYPLQPNGTGGFSGIVKTPPFSGSGSSSAGKWTVSGLPAGSYVVYLDDPQSRATSEYVGSTGPVVHAANAQDFVVKAGATTTRPGTTPLVAGSSPSATPDLQLAVVDDSATGVEGADVSLTSTDDGGYSWSSGPTTDAGGELTIPKVPSGSYELSVIARDSEGDLRYQPYVSDFSYDSSSPLVGATLVDLDGLNWLNGVQPVVTSSAVVGDTVSVTGAVLGQDGGSVSYQWLRDGKNIYGATSSTYTTVGGDYGTTLTVTVTGTKPDLDAVTFTGSVGVITAGAQITNVTGPGILGADSQNTIPWDQTLTLSPGSWSVPGVSLDVDWFDAENNLLAAHQLTFTPTSAQIGLEVHAVVDTSKPGYPSANAYTTTAVSIADGTAPTVVKAPKITLKKLAGGATQYTATGAVWSRSTTTTSYIWALDGASQSANPTIVVSKADAVKKLTVSVIGLAPSNNYDLGADEIVVKNGTEVPTSTGSPSVIAGYPSSVVGATDSEPMDTILTLDDSTSPLEWHYPIAGEDSGFSTFQWYRQFPGHAPIKIAGATSDAHVVVLADIGASLSLTISSIRTDYATGTVTIPAGVGALRNDLGTADLAIDGSTTAGAILTSSITPEWGATKQTYAWFLCAPTGGVTCSTSSDFKAITKATGATYTTLSSQSGDQLQLRVTGTSAGWTPVTVTSNTITLATSKAIGVIQNPSLPSKLNAESARVGNTYTAVPGTYDVSGLTRKYSWKVCDALANDCDTQANWTQASGSTATKATYKLVAGDLKSQNTDLEVVETVSRSGYSSATGVSAPTSVAPAAAKGPAPTTNPVPISGSAFGDILTIDAGSIFSYGSATPAPAYSYQWSVAGKAVAGATKSSFVPPSTDAGKVVGVKVTAKDPDYADGSYSTSITLAYAAEVDCTPTVAHSGAVVPGAVLTGSTASCTTAGETFTYQWDQQVGSGLWTAIPGAKKTSYTPTIAQAGDNVRLDVQALVPGHQIGSESSAPIAVGYLLDLQSTVAPSIAGIDEGTAAVGTQLTASSGTWSATGLAYAYQWYRNGVAIPGATTPTYTVTASSLGDDLVAKVTASHVGYATVTAASSTVTVIAGAAPQNTSLPLITGQLYESSLLTASPGAWNTVGLTFTYQWYADGVAIPDATGNIYETPSDSAAENPGITVVVTASRSGYTSATATSAAQPIADTTAP